METADGEKIDYRFHEIDPLYVKPMNKMYKYLAKHHNHKMIGEENIPLQGPCLFALNHSLATYDIGIFQYKVYKKTGIYPRGFADNAFFKVPFVGKVAGKTGAIPGKHNVGEYLLKEKKDFLMVAPGGMRESLRPKSEKYQIKWDTRKGFVKLALKTQTPIVLAACPLADDLYKVYDSKLTKLVYNRLRLPLPIIKGKGKGGILPEKVDLTHYIAPPILPPKVDLNNESEFKETVDSFHKRIVVEMESLMARRD